MGIAISFCHASCLRQCRGQDLLLLALVLSEAWREPGGEVLDILDKSPTWRNNSGSQRPGCSNSIIQISEQWLKTPCGRICPVPYVPLSLSFTPCSPAWWAMVAMLVPNKHVAMFPIRGHRLKQGWTADLGWALICFLLGIQSCS